MDKEMFAVLQEEYKPTALDEQDYMQYAAIRDVCDCIENPNIDHIVFMQELNLAMTKSFIQRTLKEREKEDATSERK